MKCEYDLFHKKFEGMCLARREALYASKVEEFRVHLFPLEFKQEVLPSFISISLKLYSNEKKIICKFMCQVKIHMLPKFKMF